MEHINFRSIISKFFEQCSMIASIINGAKFVSFVSLQFFMHALALANVMQWLYFHGLLSFHSSYLLYYS